MPAHCSRNLSRRVGRRTTGCTVARFACILVSMFDDLADVYEAMIDWPKRLANEEAFYRRLFERVGVRSVIDVACGTGHHAAMFHSWGLRVEGADLSPAMIERARGRFGQPRNLRWTVRAFDQAITLVDPFDAAVCVGNSLALAPDVATVERAIRRMLATVRDGGAIVVQVLNLWRLADGPCVWQKCLRTRLPGPSLEDILIIKGIHRCGDRGYVELIVADPSGATKMQTESTPFLGLEAPDLECIARAAGAKSVSLFGTYQEQPYHRQKSIDLVMVAEK
jgi:SAM-dependent methyltransferase